MKSLIIFLQFRDSAKLPSSFSLLPKSILRAEFTDATIGFIISSVRFCC